MPTKKVDLRGLIDDLISEVVAIDADDEMPRGRKTQAIERAATKFKNRLHDSRKKKDSQRISLGTYNKYLTEARREITKQNWKHHSLPEQIERLSKKHPEYAGRLRAWLSMGIEEMRFAHRDFLREILQKDKTGTGPESELYKDIREMKLDHEVMLHLTKNAVQSASFRDQQITALEQKKESNSRVRLNYHKYVELLLDLLTRPTVMTPEGATFAFSRLALGLAGATGRRMIEVVWQGQFKKLDKHRLRFTGQAKKRGGVDMSEAFDIYTLIDADIVLAALDQMRNLPEVQSLHEFDHLDEVERNTRINWRIHSNLNTAAARELASVCHADIDPAEPVKDAEITQRRVFKDTRTIYARISYDLFYRTDKRWKGKDEDVFWRDILGHEGLKALQNYKQFEVDYTEPETADPQQPVRGRLEGLRALDDEVAKRKAFIKMHDWAKAQVADNPAVVITKSQLIRLKVYRPTIEDYMALAGDLLTKPEQPDAHAAAVKPKPPKRKSVTASAASSVSAQDILELVRTSNEKPRVQAAEDGPDGWAGVVLLAGVEVVRVTAHTSQMDALRAAYAAYEALLRTAEQQA